MRKREQKEEVETEREPAGAERKEVGRQVQ